MNEISWTDVVVALWENPNTIIPPPRSIEDSLDELVERFFPGIEPTAEKSITWGPVRKDFGRSYVGHQIGLECVSGFHLHVRGDYEARSMTIDVIDIPQKRRGIGTQIVNGLKKISKNCGYFKVRAYWVDPSAESFFHRLGFTERSYEFSGEQILTSHLWENEVRLLVQTARGDPQVAKQILLEGHIPYFTYVGRSDYSNKEKKFAMRMENGIVKGIIYQVTSEQEGCLYTPILTPHSNFPEIFGMTPKGLMLRAGLHTTAP